MAWAGHVSDCSFCDESAETTCESCGEPICPRHLQDLVTQVLCPPCADDMQQR
jgi:formylmethanofuran dehydrogenase subunit E